MRDAMSFQRNFTYQALLLGAVETDAIIPKKMAFHFKRIQIKIIWIKNQFSWKRQ
jgi:hypothetical protein